MKMIIVADNLHVLNPVVADAMRRLDPEPLRELAIRCQCAGAQWIDVNPGYLSRRNEDRMAFMVETLQNAVPGMRLVLDSPSPRVLANGLAACRETPILNALSLEKEKLEEILPLAVEHHTSLVILLMDERSYTPPTMDEKLALAVELRERALAAGLPHENLIFDPVIPNLSWPEAFGQVSEIVRVVRLLASGAVFGEPARLIVGLSNLRSGLRNRYPVSLDSACLGLLSGAGLDHVLCDVLDPNLMETVGAIKQMTR
ncbi:MAG: dihydropteroate synthase [Syntrophobacteraceae bacterium]